MKLNSIKHLKETQTDFYYHCWFLFKKKTEIAVPQLWKENRSTDSTIVIYQWKEEALCHGSQHWLESCVKLILIMFSSKL